MKKKEKRKKVGLNSYNNDDFPFYDKFQNEIMVS
jgi:hypothetical protein